MNADIDRQMIYEILLSWIVNGKVKPQSYTTLSNDYHKRTEIWHEPHGSWDSLLGNINNALSSIEAPALSALVIVQSTNLPGGGFWGCAPNVPSKPSGDEGKIEEWMKIIKEIEKYEFPEMLPKI